MYGYTKGNIVDFIEILIDKIREAFAAAFRDISDTVILKQLTEAIEIGDYETVWRLLGVMPGSLRPLTLAIEQSFEEGARWIAQNYPKIVQTNDGKGVFRFNILNPRAQEWLSYKSGTLITNITEDARQSVRNTMEGGMIAGRNPRAVALDIVGRYDRATGGRVGGTIGLTPQQQGWVANVRQRLLYAHVNGVGRDGAERYLTMALRDKRFDGVVRRAMEDGKPLTVEQIDRLVTRYADRTLKYRGDMIARTEAMESLSAARYESTKQVVESGAAREKDVKRKWDATADTRTRHSHVEMEGQTVGLNEPYVSPVTGARLMYPHDRSLGAPAEELIACRCTEVIEIDWLGVVFDD